MTDNRHKPQGEILFRIYSIQLIERKELGL